MYKIFSKVFFLRVIIVLMMLFIMACDAEGTKDTTQNSNLTMFIASDIHYLDKDLYDEGEAFQNYTKNANGRNFLYIDEVVDAFTYEVENKRPDICR